MPVQDVAAWPTFQMAGGLPLALARCCFVAALFSLVGASVFRLAVQRDARRVGRLVPASAAVALAGLIAWATLQAMDVGGVLALPMLLRHTRFGHLVLGQGGALLAVALALATGRPRLATAAALAALILQAGHGHAASMGMGPRWASVIVTMVHLVAGAVWLGGLAPFAMAVARATPIHADILARRFSRIAVMCVLLLAGTATLQYLVLIGSPAALIGTSYGLAACAKLGLFAVLLGFAARHRLALTPALRGADGRATKRRLVRSVAVESAVGMAVLLAATVLTAQPPAMHIQPVWPFAVQPSLDTIREDAGFRRDVIVAALALSAALVVLVAALILGRLRLPALAIVAIAAWFAAPNLGLLLIEAHPTSYFISPTSFAAQSIATGQFLYPIHCAACHGAAGRGDGPAAKTLPVPPADLTAAHLWMHSDGELFWWLSHGIDMPDGSAGPAMPGFSATLGPEQRWALIDAIRARNAGLAWRASGQWPVALAAPELQADCAGVVRTMGDLRGTFVRLVFGPALAAPDMTTITIGPPASPGVCAADDETIGTAYALLLGTTPSELAGTQVLIDADGFLRAVDRAGNWHDPKRLAALRADLAAHPVGQSMQRKMSMSMPM